MDSFASIANLKDLKVYQLARRLGKLVWDIVAKWDYSKRKTIGDQWTESTDSVSANIAEGYGRYYFNEIVRFYYFARGSEFESYDWFEKAKERNLLSDEEIDQYQLLYEEISKELNMLIKRTRTNAKQYRNQ